jgi:hypothetical protein
LSEPLEALQHQVTPLGLHHLLVDYDNPDLPEQN